MNEQTDNQRGKQSTQITQLSDFRVAFKPPSKTTFPTCWRPSAEWETCLRPSDAEVVPKLSGLFGKGQGASPPKSSWEVAQH